MIKNTVYVILAIAITAGAAHSYDELRFGERTALFFRVVFANEGGAAGFRGQRGFEGRGEGDARWMVGDSSEMAARFERIRMARGEIRGRPEGMREPPAEQLGVGRTRMERSDRDRDRGGRGLRGAAVSLTVVSHYSLILAFAAMATYMLDGLIKKAVRGRPARQP